MKHLSISLEHLGLMLAASAGFAGSTWAFKTSLDTGDQRWMVGAFAALIVSYVPYLTLLKHSMSVTIVATSMISQILALFVAIAVYGEPMTGPRILGVIAALVAVAAFAMPHSTHQ